MPFGNRRQRASSILEDLSDHEKNLPVSLSLVSYCQIPPSEVIFVCVRVTGL